jgi:hypothetical protein
MQRDSIMNGKIVRLVVMCSTVTVLAGCYTTKLTRNNYGLVRVDVHTKQDVYNLLGPPTAQFDDEWMYDDLNRHVSARVHFDTEGRVISKEWMDSEGGEWEGRDPKTDPPPEGEVRERRTTIRQYEDD